MTITVNELKMLKFKAFSSHPWIQANVGRSLSHIRREMGEDAWALLTVSLEKARATKDTGLWHSVIDPLITKVIKDSEEKRLADLETERLEEEKRLQAEAAARIITENIVRVSPLTGSRSNMIVKRIKR